MTQQPYVDLTGQPIIAGATPLYRCQIVDGYGAPIPAASLSTLTLSIVDVASGAYVNNCQDANILNSGRGTVDSQGNVAVQFVAGDSALVRATDQQEVRAWVLAWSYNSGASVGKHQVNALIVAPEGA